MSKKGSAALLSNDGPEGKHSDEWRTGERTGDPVIDERRDWHERFSQAVASAVKVVYKQKYLPSKEAEAKMKIDS